MEFYNDIHGAAPVILEFQVTATMETAGIPVVGGAAAEAGVTAATTTAAADLIGVTLDTATYVTAQQTDNSDPAASVKVIINPFAIYNALLSGGATSNTAIAVGTADTADTAGDDISTDIDYSAPDVTGGSIWGYQGANAGIVRKITSLTGADADVDVAFPFDIAVGDTFLVAPFSPGTTDQYVQLTTTLEQVNQAVATDADNNNFKVLSLLARSVAEDGTTNSYVRIVPCDSTWVQPA